MNNLAFLGSDPYATDEPIFMVVGIAVMIFILLAIGLVIKTVWDSTKSPQTKSRVVTPEATYTPNFSPPRSTKERVRAFIKTCLVIGAIIAALGALKGLSVWYGQFQEQKRSQKYSECVAYARTLSESDKESWKTTEDYKTCVRATPSYLSNPRF